MLVPNHRWKDLLMDFVTGLPISTNWKRDSYDSIFVIVDWHTKIVYDKSVKVTIDIPSLVEIIINVVVRHHILPDSIITDRELLFTSKFWSLLYYFFGIKRRLSIAFNLQTDGQTKRQNSTMKAYLRAFVNFKQNNWVWLLSIAKFAYKNAKNASSSHIPFKLNCGYHPRVSYKKDLDPHSKLKTVEKLSSELWNLIAVCQQNLYHAQEL